ncbi:hypothetical protein [Bifidobacterium olomucense]|uniref:Phage protein n=1 Tax=Bifidobacterium olomucense TaxID=2675324 RepID=A0A7Y0EX96_9BIFI|nr:hypothetical protein [Bifidobacterium sp. DSM 109959]NMM98105.1 phage protein [Bifidobacterium sp. DSM 109959]
MRLTIEIPNESWFSSNSRGHWAVKKRCTDAVFARAYWIGQQQRTLRKLSKPVFAKCHVTVYVAYPPHAGGRKDPGNSEPMVKAAIDALTKAGYWVDDDSTHVIGPDYRLADHRSRPGWHELVFDLEEI